MDLQIFGEKTVYQYYIMCRIRDVFVFQSDIPVCKGNVGVLSIYMY